MKSIDMRCPNCGAALKTDSDNDAAFCEYCNTKIRFDDEALHVRYDNAEQAGYEFEKGRQRARLESETNLGRDEGSMPKKKRKTWLWILGWLCCFPIPAMILIWRRENTWTIKKKIIITVIFWLALLVMGMFNDSGDKNTDSDADVKIESEEEAGSKDDKTEGTAAAGGFAEKNKTEGTAAGDDFVEKYNTEMVLAAKMSLDNFISDYKVSLAPQNWTLARFDDDGAIIAMTKVSWKGYKQDYIYVGTLNIGDDGEVSSATPHYVSVGSQVFGNDGYADEVFDKFKQFTGQ